MTRSRSTWEEWVWIEATHSAAARTVNTAGSRRTTSWPSCTVGFPATCADVTGGGDDALRIDLAGLKIGCIIAELQLREEREGSSRLWNRFCACGASAKRTTARASSLHQLWRVISDKEDAADDEKYCE
ncbi:hypothetical protein MRX96_016953 [Rhipicephalus microplus]